jgi:response regulator RpfG family c-di-GMP phosphodiesterase
VSREKPHVLIIDDDESIVSLLQKWVSQKYPCKATASSREGLEELKTGKYALCLLDLNMPSFSGFELLEEIRKTDSIDTVFTIITGNGAADDVIRAMRLGADDYILKPFKLDELGLSIERALKTYELKQENIRYRAKLENEVERKAKEIRQSYLEIIQAFVSSIEIKDSNTAGHSQRVSDIGVMLAAEMDFNNREIQHVRIGGLLHDIGKIGISDQILLKEGPLTQEEFARIRMHPVHGYNMLNGLQSLEYLVPYIYCHHERYDGSGYPQGLKGDKIPLEGRLLCLADSLDAMTSNRSYKKGKSPEEAYQEVLRNSGSQFDPRIVDAFCALWKKDILQAYLEKRKGIR